MAINSDAFHVLLKDPFIQKLIHAEPVFWANPGKEDGTLFDAEEWEREIAEAEKRLRRFAPYIAEVFPETKDAEGMIESPLFEMQHMKEKLEAAYQQPFPGRWLLKGDHELPISGSIKARGGIYEVLKHAEKLALQEGMLQETDDYRILHEERFAAFFSRYSIAVGSTGNLGLSIGIIGATLGFRVTVHMSADAKQWKKDLLRQKGVTVMEYESDYSEAVKEGRRQAEQDPFCYFIDDEHSRQLFVGYAVAASRLKNQLDCLNIQPSLETPLFVYLPCGVGGGPGGVAFGLKLLYGEYVHVFFAEPTHSPCMLLGLYSGLHEKISVQDIGLDNRTAADGLAVGRPSGFVGKLMEPLLSGCYTVEDNTLYTLLHMLAVSENKYLEPSALAGMFGPVQLFSTEEGRRFSQKYNMKHAVHVVWGTGGSMVPKEEMAAYNRIGAGLLENEMKK
ncbi:MULTISPECIES: D-serine ammonia-lyase [unclassified Bacillus (in: firmicutes)]|uniref:D-serine ammonia-lyase n=1 Tax=unclassified Bacillus (in: firmicutes) TaxID=185979 RepID=UPI002281ED17|nr:D-serine ammonia-lyase [Bacillus sp. S20C3]MCY8203431.1 D-serine ammonia-lyase [Bacillus sp. N12A5]MCY8290153.1 D-serine ammonia-lyase [Bacillus sp. N13C7]MCY8637557.1 D-serine ammonia-lyase [Bacillus sp. S17B2]MCY8720601.1 D-serine ammonia-lyase [Bacillus sp. S10C12M]MCY9145124.1 D-serine ammonia-lyase [Bacillus sp. T9C1]